MRQQRHREKHRSMTDRTRIAAVWPIDRRHFASFPLKLSLLSTDAIDLQMVFLDDDDLRRRRLLFRPLQPIPCIAFLGGVISPEESQPTERASLTRISSNGMELRAERLPIGSHL